MMRRGTSLLIIIVAWWLWAARGSGSRTHPATQLAAPPAGSHDPVGLYRARRSNFEPFIQPTPPYRVEGSPRREPQCFLAGSSDSVDPRLRCRPFLPLDLSGLLDLLWDFPELSDLSDSVDPRLRCRPVQNE